MYKFLNRKYIKYFKSDQASERYKLNGLNVFKVITVETLCFIYPLEVKIGDIKKFCEFIEIGYVLGKLPGFFTELSPFKELVKLAEIVKKQELEIAVCIDAGEIFKILKRYISKQEHIIKSINDYLEGIAKYYTGVYQDRFDWQFSKLSGKGLARRRLAFSLLPFGCERGKSPAWRRKWDTGQRRKAGRSNGMSWKEKEKG